MKKIDYKKELKHLYRASPKNTVFVDVPEMNYLMINGKGAPGSNEFQKAIEALFSLSYTLKFMIKKGDMQIDYGVLPLEGLWWVDDMSKFSMDKKDDWKWTAMIMQPEIITKQLVNSAVEQVKLKKDLKALSKVKFEAFKEGKVAQIMHIGPFAEEGPTVQKVHDFITENDFSISGKHHEIYLSDFRRAAPENLKTIIRQPFKE